MFFGVFKEGGKNVRALARNRLKNYSHQCFPGNFFKVFQKSYSAEHMCTAASVRRPVKITLPSYDSVMKFQRRRLKFFVKVTHKIDLVLNAFLIRLQVVIQFNRVPFQHTHFMFSLAIKSGICWLFRR